MGKPINKSKFCCECAESGTVEVAIRERKKGKTIWVCPKGHIEEET
jgi:hypothetical protein